MISFDYLENHPQIIPELSKIWEETIGKIWAPEESIENVKAWFSGHNNSERLPLALIAFDGAQHIGMCSLRMHAHVRSDLSPWLGSLAVTAQYQGRGIGQQLIEAIKAKAKQMDFATLHLCTYDKTLPDWYAQLGWQKIGEAQCGCHPVTVMKITL
jgi:predicted N-acetyltransferase YhbS